MARIAYSLALERIITNPQKPHIRVVGLLNYKASARIISCQCPIYVENIKETGGDCGEEKTCNSLQDAYDQGWFATDDGEHCPEHAEAAIEEEDNRWDKKNKPPANNCLTYN